MSTSTQNCILKTELFSQSHPGNSQYSILKFFSSFYPSPCLICPVGGLLETDALCGPVALKSPPNSKQRTAATSGA